MKEMQMSKTLVGLLATISILSITDVLAQESASFTCPTTGGTMRMAVEFVPGILNAIVSIDPPGNTVNQFLYEPLIGGGPERGNVIEPALAESWSISDDGLEYTFHLRKDVVWHDGEPFTAKDVNFTFEATLLESNLSHYRSALIQDGEPIHFEIIRDHIFKVTLNEPDSAMLTMLTIPILPAHAPGSLDMHDAFYNTAPLGTGPFKFVEWTDEHILLEANPRYWRGAPCLDGIEIRFADAHTAANALLAGDLDFAFITSANYEPFERNADFALIETPRDRLYYVGFNTQSEIYSDPPIRRALAIGLDPNMIIDISASGLGLLADSAFSQIVFMYEPGRNEPYPYDPELALDMLAEVGWSDTDNDGILDKDGVPMTIKLFYGNFTPEFETMAFVVEDNWRMLGLDVEMFPMDFDSFIGDFANNLNADKPYDAIVSLWGLGAEPGHMYRDYLTNENRFFAYSNSQINNLFEQGALETDPDRRYTVYAEIDRLLWNDLPLIPVYQEVGLYAHRTVLNMDAAEIDGFFAAGLKYPERIYFDE